MKKSPGQNLEDIKELEAALRDMTGHLANTPAGQRTPKDAELANLITIIRYVLDSLQETPEEEAVRTIADLRVRVRKLLDDPNSAGVSGEIASKLEK